MLYFELSSTALGADGPFASTGRLFQAGRFVSREFALELSGRQITVLNLVLVNENGQLTPINCLEPDVPLSFSSTWS